MFFDGDGCVARIAAGVDEGNHFCRILFEGILGKFIAVVHESSHVLEHGDFLESLSKFCGTKIAGSANDIGGCFGLSASTVIDELGF